MGGHSCPAHCWTWNLLSFNLDDAKLCSLKPLQTNMGEEFLLACCCCCSRFAVTTMDPPFGTDWQLHFPRISGVVRWWGTGRVLMCTNILSLGSLNKKAGIM